jgi:hypothetical protein
MEIVVETAAPLTSAQKTLMSGCRSPGDGERARARVLASELGTSRPGARVAIRSRAYAMRRTSETWAFGGRHGRPLNVSRRIVAKAKTSVALLVTPRFRSSCSGAAYDDHKRLSRGLA